MNETAPLDRLHRLQQLLAAETAVPLKDGAGIINPQGVDAAQRAAGIRRAMESINDSTGPDEPITHEVIPCQRKQP